MFTAFDGRFESGLMLMAAAALLYACSRLAVFALARPDGSDPGRRALGQWLPVAAAAIAAVCHRRADIALGVIFGSSVAFLSFVLGMATYLAPMQSLPPSRKIWPFVLPAALLPLMAGFSGRLTWYHALMLFALGGAIFLVWQESTEEGGTSSEDHPPPVIALVMALVAIALAVIGAHFAVAGTIVSGQNARMMPPGTVAATVLSALLVLPTLGTASMVAQRGHPGRAVTALVGAVLLNLCLLLPVVILLWYPLSTRPLHLANLREFKLPWNSIHGLPYDLVAWRVETVIVVVLGFGLIPASMGRLMIGRIESVLLVIAYAIYIFAVFVLGLHLT